MLSKNNLNLMKMDCIEESAPIDRNIWNNLGEEMRRRIATSKVIMKGIADGRMFSKNLREPRTCKLITFDDLRIEWMWGTHFQKLAREKLRSRGFGWMGHGELIGTFSQYADEKRAQGYRIL